MNYYLEKNKKELFDLLEKNPELRSYQERISKALDLTEESNRINVLNVFIQDSLCELLFELNCLKEILGEKRN